MRIAMIGTGYVGLVSGACFSEFGFHVICVDKDAGKVARLRAGEIPIYEPGLQAMVERNAAAGRLRFTTDLKEAMAEAEAVFIAVGTPSRRGDGFADLSYVYAAAEEIAPLLNRYMSVITKSTVPVGTGSEIARIIRAKNPRADFAMVSNPEFLREGSAIEDFMRPDRVVVGVEEPRAKELMQRLYRPLFLNETPIVFTGLETAELAKYAANAFLATKVAFINEVADICERVGADVQQVARAIGLDRRIGPKFLHPGPGFGGSCFPKDTEAMMRMAERAGAPSRIVTSVVEANAARKERMAEKIIAACGGSIQGKILAVLGLAFKPNTDDMREAASLTILPALLKAGAKVIAYDPKAMEAAKPMLPAEVAYAQGAYEAASGADALVILTEWNEFRSLDLVQLKNLLKTPLVIDLRNIYGLEEMREAGLRYHSLGREAV